MYHLSDVRDRFLQNILYILNCSFLVCNCVTEPYPSFVKRHKTKCFWRKPLCFSDAILCNGEELKYIWLASQAGYRIDSIKFLTYHIKTHTTEGFRCCRLLYLLLVYCFAGGIIGVECGICETIGKLNKYQLLCSVYKSNRQFPWNHLSLQTRFC